MAAGAPRRARREALPWSAAAPPATVRWAEPVPASRPARADRASHPESGTTRSEADGRALAGAGAGAPRRYSPSVENSTTVSSAAPNRSLSRGNMRSTRYVWARTEGPSAATSLAGGLSGCRSCPSGRGSGSGLARHGPRRASRGCGQPGQRRSRLPSPRPGPSRGSAAWLSARSGRSTAGASRRRRRDP